MNATHLFDLRGATALITGGSRGIGSFIARGFVEAGVKVFISSRDAEVCDAMAAELSEFGECISLPCNVGDREARAGLVAEIAARTSKLNILVNNAGTAWTEPLETYAEEHWDRVMNLNLKTAFQLSQKLLPLLKAAGTQENPARIINIGSLAGINLAPRDIYSYSVSKAGLHHLSRLMALRLAEHNITVNAIAPGPFETRMIAFALKNRPALEAQVPRGYVGSGDDIAGAAIFLASRAGAYVTGTVLPVDGGMSLRGGA